jgi:butyryl-CoA dehydrogenase
MCLTEPGAGSSLSDIITTAEKNEDGSYRINGQKIFITAGDQDITENIIHLVLARVSGAVKGVKGISLFIVPKKRREGDKEVDNDVHSIGVYHKMGQRSTPAMHLEFGANNNCKGWLIGEEGNGLFYMFQMMNSARLGVGLAGTFIASAAYYASLQYAKERPQGRRLRDKDPNKPQTTIVHHPDVRRMLFLQKSLMEGAQSLVMQCYLYTDLEKICAPGEAQRYKDLLNLLTPVAKTCGAEMGIIAVNNGLQVLGGYGYTQDFILEQLARDIRIMSLYEGTTGIQSLGLLGRQVPTNNGRALQYWKEESGRDIELAKAWSDLHFYACRLEEEIISFDILTRHLMEKSLTEDPEIFLSDANLYMELFGILNLGWQWLKQGRVAREILEGKRRGKQQKIFYQSKIETMQFYFHYELVKTKALLTRLNDNKMLTLWKEEEPLL